MSSPYPGPSYTRQPTAPPSSRASDLPTYHPFHSVRSSPAPGPSRVSSIFHARSSPVRSTTPARSRARSASVFAEASEKRRLQQIDKQRQESSLRLRSAWESILEKYGDVGPGEDDEIDLVTFEVKKCTGHLVKYSEENKFSWEEWGEEESFCGVESEDGHGESEDELGRWDEKSGLDDQEFEEVRGKFVRRPWNEDDWEDKLDRAAFLRDEAKRREALGEQALEEEEDGDTDWAETDGDEEQQDQQFARPDDTDEDDDDDVPLSLGKRKSDKPSDEEGLVDSEDELVAQTSDAEQATSVVYLEGGAPAPESPSTTPPRQWVSATNGSWSRADRQKSVVEVEIPSYSLRTPSTLPNPLSKVFYQDSDPSLADLFISSPSHSPLHSPVGLDPQPIAGPSRLPNIPQAAHNPPSRSATQASELDPIAYFPKQALWRDGVTVRKCKACLAAGGERRRWAKLCKGRRGGRSIHCTFEQPGKHIELPLSTNIARPPEPEAPIRVPETPRHTCDKCERAGGIRAERARTCRGHWKAQGCPIESAPSRKSSRQSRSPREMHTDNNRVPPNVDASKLDGRRYHSDVNYTHEGARIRTCAACDASGGLRMTRAAWCRGRWRVAQCTFVIDANGKRDEEDADSLRSWSPASEKGTIQVESAGSIQTSLRADTAYLAAIEDARRIRSYAARELRPMPSSFPLSSIPASTSPQSSLPPSSPPIFHAGEATLHGDSFRPSPSPSTSAPYASTPIRSTHWHPTALSSSSRSCAALRAHSTLVPTPPTSVGLRGSSMSSDAHLSLTRRGILRQPTDFDRPSPARSLKRARFSLVPLSPPPVLETAQNPSADSDFGDEDELLLAPSSPIRAMTHQPTWRPTSILRSSSPRSKELDVRARDVGLKLSEHTGRLSSGMLAALAPTPALPGQKSTITLASSLRYEVMSDPKFPTGQYSLPTPPPSFGSSRREEKPATPALSPKSTLMLPPPVPQHVTTLHRMPTPVSAEEGEGSDDMSISTTRKRIVASHPRVAGRSRAKSLGAMTTSRKNTQVLAFTPTNQRTTVPATTPRKRRRTLFDEEEEVRRANEQEEMEWGMDEDAGEDLSRSFRDSSVFHFVD